MFRGFSKAAGELQLGFLNLPGEFTFISDFQAALKIQDALQDHIEHRLKTYTKCIAKSTPNYFKYLVETYNRQLRQELRSILDDIEE